MKTMFVENVITSVLMLGTLDFFWKMTLNKDTAHYLPKFQRFTGFNVSRWLNFTVDIF